jgi:hypothetical protein
MRRAGRVWPQWETKGCAQLEGAALGEASAWPPGLQTLQRKLCSFLSSYQQCSRDKISLSAEAELTGSAKCSQFRASQGQLPTHGRVAVDSSAARPDLSSGEDGSLHAADVGTWSVQLCGKAVVTKGVEVGASKGSAGVYQAGV